jgi:glycosyltransferase involved in cell wall biosynthesis
MIRLCLLTNIPAPYRVPVLNRLAMEPQIDLHVIYAARREPDRNWDLPAMRHRHEFLRESVYCNSHGRFIHNNPEVFARLRQVSPDVVVTTGFNPTHLFGFAYSQLHGKRHVAMTDGTILSEAHLGWMHKAARQVVFARSSAFIAASRASRELLITRGAARERIFLSPLCANTSLAWRSAKTSPVRFDMLFSGRLVAIKNPLFALEVAAATSRELGRRVTLAILGGGPLQDAVKETAARLSDRVDSTFAGHVAQADMPGWFGAARLFLFPTTWDPWGVVANEACMAGLPAIVSPHAGAAGELIVDGQNGYVRPLDLQLWTAACTRLLTSPALHEQFSQEGLRRVQPYNFETAALGIAAAARDAARRS